MGRKVLLVDERDARRGALRNALVARGVECLEFRDPFHAMGALGRADFNALVMAEGARQLSRRGLCLLARKRHPHMRICVLGRDSSDEARARLALGVSVVPLDGERDAEWLARRVVDEMARPELQPFDVPSTTQVAAALDMVSDEVNLEAAQPRAGRTLLMGELARGDAPAVLGALCAQELTGRLVVDSGPAEGTLFFLRGDPVWATRPGGDGAHFRLLKERGWIPATATQPMIPEGELLGALALAGVIGSQELHAFMREHVRQQVLAFLGALAGACRFVEDQAFLNVTPLLKVNAVGLMLEGRRTRMAPDALLAVAVELEEHFIIAEPGLRTVARRLAPFMRGRDVVEILGQPSTLGSFWETSGLGMLVGTLLALTLRDARLVALSSEAPVLTPAPVLLQDPVPSAVQGMPVLPEQDIELVSPGETEHQRAARDEVMTLYACLKPMHAPHQILGVALSASEREVEQGYHAMIGKLNTFRFASGPVDAVLSSRVAELHSKVEAAYHTLKATFLQPTVASGSGGNPF
ncbi:MAG: DUF4388 domain-containing protein [Myxococcota bacterium]